MANGSACPSCGGPVARAVARCPRCGAARATPYRHAAAVPEPTAPRGTWVRRAESPDDAADRARPFAKSGEPQASSDPDDGVFSGMISPHPASTPGERAIQIALTTLALPVIVASFLTVGLLFVRYVAAVRRQHGSLAASIVRAPGIANPLAWVAGGALLVLVSARAIPPGITIAYALAQMVLLGIRALVRARIRERVELERALATRRR